MITIEKALKLVTGELPILKSERIPLPDSIGRTLAEDTRVTH